MLDYTTLEHLRTRHPAWRLLRSDHAALITSFLHRVFIQPNVRVMPAVDLIEALEDELYAVREQLCDEAFPKSAHEYLNDWASTEKGWLRKFYLPGSDEAQFDLTPATEKAIAWLTALSERSFIGTESRLLTLFDLLKQMTQGSETDPDKRIAELEKQRAEIDADIARIQAGDIILLDDSALKDRFQQFMQLARELLTDFREVEHNFRQLDRKVREQIALWEGAKGALLEEIMGERDAIGDSDQGKSFRAFCDFLMSSRRQEELTGLLQHVLTLPPVVELKPDARTRRIHYDWLEAGEHTLRTVAQLSLQLRRFLDDQAWLENKNIMSTIHNIEANALALRQTPPTVEIMQIEQTHAAIELTMERTLYTPAIKPIIADLVIQSGDSDIDSTALYTQIVVDKARLTRHIRQSLQTNPQILLRQLIRTQPLKQGLAELIAYLQLGSESFKTVIDENTMDTITWETHTEKNDVIHRQARLPRVIFVRST